jgi:hypothetical protein
MFLIAEFLETFLFGSFRFLFDTFNTFTLFGIVWVLESLLDGFLL